MRNVEHTPRVRGPFEGFGMVPESGRPHRRPSVSGCFIESTVLPKVGQPATVSIAIRWATNPLKWSMPATHGFRRFATP